MSARNGSPVSRVAEAAAAIEAALPPHRGPLDLSHDPHKATGLTVAAWMEMLREEPEWASPDERAASVAGNTIWVADWTTSEGQRRWVAASSLPALLARVMS